MERQEILKQLNEIFVITLENTDINISESTQANDIDEWTSLSNMLLIVAIENHFKIKFKLKEILSWRNVGEMLTAIIEKSI